MKDTLFKLTIPTISALLLSVSTLIGAVGYFYSLDNRVSLLEQNVVHVQQDKIELEKHVDEMNAKQDNRQIRLEDKIDKIYDILVANRQNR